MVTEMTNGTMMEYAMARYNGVAIWSSVVQPRTQVRALNQTEKVALIEDVGDGWLRVRLPEDVEGFVRRDALRPFAEGSPSAPRVAHANASPDSPRAAYVAPAGAVPGGDHAYAGARWVAIGLMVFAWVSLVGGQLLGFVAAASYECSNSFISDCSDEAGSRFFLYVTFAGPSFITALFAWGISYAVFLADKIEMRVRGTAA